MRARKLASSMAMVFCASAFFSVSGLAWAQVDDPGTGGGEPVPTPPPVCEPTGGFGVKCTPAPDDADKKDEKKDKKGSKHTKKKGGKKKSSKRHGGIHAHAKHRHAHSHAGSKLHAHARSGSQLKISLSFD